METEIPCIGSRAAILNHVKHYFLVPKLLLLLRLCSCMDMCACLLPQVRTRDALLASERDGHASAAAAATAAAVATAAAKARAEVEAEVAAELAGAEARAQVNSDRLNPDVPQPTTITGALSCTLKKVSTERCNACGRHCPQKRYFTT